MKEEIKVPKLSELTPEGKEELALMILLWKDFKQQHNTGDVMGIIMQAIQISMMLGVEKEFQDMMAKLPPMRFEPR